jgi:hypothetical protein
MNIPHPTIFGNQKDKIPPIVKGYTGMDELKAALDL